MSTSEVLELELHFSARPAFVELRDICVACGTETAFSQPGLAGQRARLDSADRQARLAALRELEGFEDYGLVDSAVAAATLAQYARRARRG